MNIDVKNITLSDLIQACEELSARHKPKNGVGERLLLAAGFIFALLKKQYHTQQKRNAKPT